MTILDGLLLVILQNHAHGIFRLRHADDIFTGLGIRLSVFQFFARFANFLWAKEGFPREKEQIALLSWAKCSSCSLKKSKWAKSAGSHSLLGKTVKEFVKQFARFLWPIRSNHERIPHNSLFTGTNCSQLLPNPAYLCRWIHACNIVKPADEIYIYTYLHAVDIIKPADEIFLYLNDIFGWIHACDIVEPCGWHFWMDPCNWYL